VIRPWNSYDARAADPAFLHRVRKHASGPTRNLGRAAMPTATNLMINGPNGKLAVRTKGLEAKPANVVVLVQGANISGQSGYDFSFPGGRDYSMMDAFVAGGLGAVTFALSGYHTSDPPKDPMQFNTDRAIEDLHAVMQWVVAQGYAKPFLLGWSWGGRIVGRFTERYAAMVARLVLLDPALGGGQKILPAPTEPYWPNSHADYMKRMLPEYTDDDARQAFADLVMAQDPRAPSGIRVENAVGSTPVNPTAISCPTLMLYGVGAAKQDYMQGSEPRGTFFERLATDDKALVIVPGGGDYAHVQRARRRCQKAILEFLLA
jgi:pimeloyl-ACP methyl ester carboxylesterase